MPQAEESAWLSSMARCSLCESEVPDDRGSCDACGHPLDHSLPATASPRVARKAIEAARKELVADPPAGVDLGFARGLLERSEQTEAAGDLGRALALARAARRAGDLTKRRALVTAAFQKADIVLQEAKSAGIETTAFERTMERAKGLAARGEYLAASKILRRVSVRALDQRRERALQNVLARAAARLAHAKERGAAMAEADSVLADAQEALALRDYGRVRALAAKAIGKAEAARRYASAEAIVDRAAMEVEGARASQVATMEARRLLTQARDALRRGVYAEVPILANKVRHAIREARRSGAAEAVLREEERKLRREERRGTDVSKAAAVLAEAEHALSSRDYARVRSLARDLHDAVREASLLKRVRDAHAALLLDLEDLKASGADSKEFESILGDLGRALGAGDLVAARRLVAQARHAGEAAREAHHRALMEASLKIILMNAARGLDPEVGRQLLRQVDDAISLGKAVDVQSLIDEHLVAVEAETAGKLQARVVQARDEIVKLRQAGVDTVAMEGKLADAAIALQEKRLNNADGLLDAVEHDCQSVRETLRGTAAEILGRVRGEVEQAKASGLTIPPPILQMVEDGETAYSESRYGDTIYVGTACMEEVRRITETQAQHEADLRASRERAREDRIRQIRARAESVAREVERLVEDQVDLAMAMEALREVSRQIEAGNLSAAEKAVAVAEGMVEGAKAMLKKQAAESLAAARKSVETAREEGLLTPEMEAALGSIEAAMASDSPMEPIRLAAELQRKLEEKRRERSQEQQKVALDKARSAATKFIAVKRLIEDLRRADIDITGAQDRLSAAEKALENKAFDDVDSILSGLDETAQELMDELIAAARNLIARADRRAQDARARGLDVAEAMAFLAKAEEHFDHKEYAEAIENARAAEKQVEAALQALEAAQAEESRLATESARTDLTAVRKTIADLARADITIVGADAAMAKAETAFESGRYADVGPELAEVKEMAQGLTLGLEAAARDLVRTAEEKVDHVRAAGFDPGRADLVLINAREAIDDGRFVEAIEYKKVIEDILTDVEKSKVVRTVKSELRTLQRSIESHASLGADMRIPMELLGKANERIDGGDFSDLETSVQQVEHAIELAAKAHLDGLVTSLGVLVDEGESLGLERAELEEIQVRAADAAIAGDLGEVYRIRGDLQERVLQAKQDALLRRSQEEIRGLDDLLGQSERVGIPVGAARDHLGQARQALAAGDIDGFQHGMAQAKEALEESRSRHFTQRYEARVHSVSTMIANAKRLGADIAETEDALTQAEDALRRNDLALADILIKQAEVSVGIQITNFIKNRYPNLVLHLPVSGLQANNWNRYVFEVENRGKLPARNVEFAFEGDVEVKGSTPIPELGVDERKLVEVGLKPSETGDLPLAVGVSYQRMFDENRYELKDKQTVHVEPEGTYLVEDVFLIHSDGRLISHHSRKFREEIDEDIFSGMLTVVQDFIKDSFKSRTRLGIKRLDFGDSKILIERSPHTFLATVVLGQEPNLLPLYILQILKEVEDKYGDVLEKWTGLLNRLAGVDDIIKKLLFVSKDPATETGELSDSPITLTAKVIEALGAQQTIEANRLLAQAESALETDIRLAWQFIEQARVQAEVARSQLGSRMTDILAAARDTVKEMKAIGVDTSQAELLLREAEEAFEEKKYEKVREIYGSLHESLERAKGEQAAKRMEIELASLINDIQIARSQNLDVREAESYLTKIENAIQKRNYRQMEDYLRRAKDSLARQRRHTVLARAREELDRLRTILQEARDVHADLGEVAVLVEKAEAVLQGEDIHDLEPLIDRAKASAKAHVEKILKDRYPRLFLETSSPGLQANRWNRFELSITNKGDWPAKMVIPVVNGPADVEGLRSIDRIEPSQKVSMEFGLKPVEAGPMDLDFEVHYVRPLDDARNQVTESTVVRVEPEGSYAVDDAMLFHADGRLIAHESRPYLLSREAGSVTVLEADAKSFVTKAFLDPSAKGLQRAEMNGQALLATRGSLAHLVLRLQGREPTILPL